MSEATEGKTEGKAPGAEDVTAKLAEYEERVQKMDAKISELLDEKKTEAAKRKEAEEAARKAAEEQARKAGDVEAVEKNLRKHFAKELEERESKLSTVTQQLQVRLVRDEANRIAMQHAVDTDSIPALSEWIEHRLTMDVRDGQYTTVVKGSDGKPNGLSVDEFAKGLVKEKSLARLLKASEASGGGANGATKSGGAAPKTIARTAFERMTAEARMAHVKGGGTITD